MSHGSQKTKKHMKPTVTQTKILTFIAGLAVLASATLRADAASSQKGGTDIMHYTIQASMTADAAVSNATGTVYLQHKAQGNAVQDMLTISVRGLEPNEPYRLVIPAANPADPASLPTLVANFTTDRKGNAVLRYKETAHAKGNSSSNGNGKAKGHSKNNGNSLPAPVDPLTAVDKLAVIDAGGATLLSVGLAAPNKFAYLIKRDISTTTVRGSLKLIASHDKAALTLQASGLTPSASYSLKLNGGVPEVFVADASGRLTARVDLENPVDILQVSTVELLDAASVVILSATLP